MAITSGASPGIVVTSAAVNETIPSQANVSDANTQVEVSDDISTLSNGNLETTPTYVGRLIILRQGLSNEETRYISAAAASGVGNTWILTVSEPWTSNPVASTDTIHVSYIIQDAATLTGLTLVNKTVQDYNSGRRFTVGSGGGTFAYMAFVNGVGLQMDDNGSTTVASFTVENGGRFDCGYLQGGTPQSGCYLQGANGTNGELAFEVISGGEWNCYATFITGVNRELADFNTSTTSKIRFNGVRWSFIINDFLIGSQDTDMFNVAFLSDGGGTSPRIDVRDWATGNEVKNISCNGFDGFESNTSGDDPTLTNIEFAQMTKLLTVATAETWTIINMIDDSQIDTASQNDISIAGTGEVLIQNRQDILVKDLTESALTAKVYVITNDHRGGATYNSRAELTADANGVATHDLERRRLTDNAGTSLTDDVTTSIAMTVSQYGYKPVVRSITPSNDDETSNPKQYGNAQSFTLAVDEFQVETTQSTAITQGDTTQPIAIETQTNPATLLKFTGGSGTDPSIGDTIGNSVNAAEGTLVALIEGDWTAGTLLLDTRNATAWETGAHSLDDAASAGNWTATYTASSIRSFSWLLDVQSNTSQQVYDWFNAKLDEATLDRAGIADFDDILGWSEGGTRALPIQGVATGSPNTFRLVNEPVKNEGFMIYNTDDATNGRPNMSGWVDFEDDNDAVFTPASTVTLSVTVLEDDFTTVNPGARVGIHLRVAPFTEYLNAITNGSGVASTSFSYTSDIDVFVRVRDEAFDYQKIPATITSTGLTVVAAPNDDDIYSAT